MSKNGHTMPDSEKSVNDRENALKTIPTERPIKAESYFWISNVVIQVIKFKYHDPDLNYYSLDQSGTLSSILREIQQICNFISMKTIFILMIN